MKIKGISLLAFVFVVLGLTSCVNDYVANYSVGLSSVERSLDAKQQFGETKVMDLTEKGVSNNHYEDDYIDVVWSVVNQKQFNFTLKNKSSHTIKINWDDISYVDTEGFVGRVVHAGVKYADRNNSQPAITVPKGACISDMLLPTENVSFRNGGMLGQVYIPGGWEETYLFPCVYKGR